jgi:hypothetical protein
LNAKEHIMELQRGEVLCVPKRRRLVHSTAKDPEGQDVLHVFYGEKEIIFDDPELLPFGGRLLEAERFRAEEAMSWSNGAPHDWEKVRELLEALLEQEILKRVTESASAPTASTFPERLGGGSAPGQEPRTFGAHRDQCPAITQEAFGRAIDLGNLEAVVPVYRVAHPALDTDGRQVGENNVSPRSLFLDLPTQRRLCNYAGNRYQADVPMNVTALKAMTSRWPELLSLTEQLRTAFFARLPRRGPSLQVGELHLLAVCGLASAGYVMVRGVGPVENGQLDSGLAAMFRLIDGVRLVTTEMMRATAGAHGCERPVTARDVADYAERHAVYYGTHGVCAGPAALIDEYLRVLLGEASAPVQVDPGWASRVGDPDAALDYGLVGQRIESLIRVFGASQGQLHERLRATLHEHTPRTRLQDLLEAPIDSEHFSLLREDHPLGETFELELDVNRWLFARAGEALPGAAQAMNGLTRLDRGAQAQGQRRLAEFFAVACPDLAPTGSLREELAAVAADLLTLERRCLRAVAGEQRRLDARLRRDAGRPLTGHDLAVYNKPRTGPPFEGTLAAGLDLAVRTDATSTVLSRGDLTLALTD